MFLTLYNSIPSQLAKNNKFYITKVTNKKVTNKDRKFIFDLLNSKTILPFYKVNDPSLSLNGTKDIDNFKLYLSDIGLFTTMLFNDKLSTNENIYIKLLSDKLDVNLGYLYENAIAQIIKSNDRDLFYYVFKNDETTRSYEIYFLTRRGNDEKLDILGITKDDLTKKGFKYHDCYIGLSKKGEACKNLGIDVFIDDSVMQIEDVNKYGIKTILVDNWYNKEYKGLKAQRFQEIYNTIRKWNNAR